MQTWAILLGDVSHVVTLGSWGTWRGAPSEFTCDVATIKLTGRVPSRIRTASFDIAGHVAEMTRRIVSPSLRLGYRRAFGGSLRRLPSTILAYALAGPGVGGGVAGANATSAMLVWVLYELTVDGISRGTWVATVVDGQARAWTFVDPGGSVPDGTDDAWPGLH